MVQADVNAMPQFMKLGTGQLSEEEEEILKKLKNKNLSTEDLKKMHDDLQKNKKDDL